MRLEVGPERSVDAAGAFDVARDASILGRTEADDLLRQAINTFACDRPSVVTLVLCEECGRDLANAVGFMCIRDGGWNKLQPRSRRR
jgi:hypothetical protein